MRKLVRSYLEKDGFQVSEAADGVRAIEMVRSERPDLVVLDLMLPEMDGLEVCRTVCGEDGPMVLMLTARADEADKLVGLGMGADDYLTKPFSPRELVARIKAVLRRSRHGAARSDDLLRFESLTIDRARRTVTVDEEAVELTTLEFDLLVTLASQPGRVFSRRQLIEAIWGWDYFGDERVVDVHIRNLRRVLGDDASEPTIVGTVRGVGYKFIPEH